jgi:L-ascorbate metabolism protein UlaG (beta-lactamase superfamily)
MRGERRGSSDHFDGRRFFNPAGLAPRPFTDVPRMLREPRTPWPAHVDVQPRTPPTLEGDAAVVTFIGHATFLIQTGAGNILTDPMFSARAGPANLAGPRRVREPAVRFEDLPPIAIVLLSHNHYDHCDRATLRRLARRFDPLLVTPLGNAPLVRAAGIRRVEELDWWDTATLASMPIVQTPARHFSARTPFDRNRALWGGFVVSCAGARVYVAGDTAYGPFFRDIGERLGPIDLACLPIGAYEPRWFMQAVHMDPAEAVQAHVDLAAARSVAMHYGTFQLTSEGIDDPLRGLEEARRARGIPAERFEALGFGDSIRLTSRSGGGRSSAS